MGRVEQLEIHLWEGLAEAAQTPEEVELAELWHLLEMALTDLNTIEQLRVAAEAIARIADLFQERSTLVFEQLEAATSDDGPIMPMDAFDRYVRQTTQVDLEQFIEPPASLGRKPPQRSPQEEQEQHSVVGELDQVALLQALDAQMSQGEGLTEAEVFNQALNVAHEEDVTAWILAISQKLESESQSMIPLLELQRSLAMPLVQLWLALLLGNYRLEQRGEFYDTHQIWVVKS